MNLITIIVRELRVRSRSSSTYWQRVGFAGLPLIACLWVFFDRSHMLGPSMLVGVSVVSMVLFGFGATLAVSDVISAERREGTLGLLFLTSLRSWELLLGLAISAGARFLLCLIAVIPVMLLPLLTGGVGWAEVLRQCLNILVVVWLGIAVGIFWSVLCREVKTSSLSGIITLILVAIVPVGIVLLSGGLGGRNPTFFEIAIGGPFFLVPLALSDVIRTQSFMAYGVSVAGVSAMGIVFFLLAHRLFNALWIRETSGIALKTTPRKSTNRFIRWLQKDWVLPTLKRRHALRFPDGVGPYQVLTRCYSRDLPFLRIVVPLVVCAFLLTTAISSQLGSPYWRTLYFEGALALLFLLDFFVRLNMSIEAPRQVLSDRRSGMLELMLTTPLPNQQIIPGLLAGISQSQGGKTFVLTMMHLIQGFILLGALSANHFQASGGIVGLMIVHLGLAFLLPWEMRALQTVGVWWGLRGVSSVRICVSLLGLTYLAPLVVLLLLQSWFERSSGIIGVLVFVLWHLARLRLWRRLLSRAGPEPERVRELVGRDGESS